MVKKVIQTVQENKKNVGEAVVHGTSLAAGTGFITWIFPLLCGIPIPAAAAAFLAGLLVPVVNYYLIKLEK